MNHHAPASLFDNREALARNGEKEETNTFTSASKRLEAAGTDWLAKHGSDANGNPLGADGAHAASEDLMSQGKSVNSPGADFVSDSALRGGAKLHSDLEADIDARTASIRRFADRHAFFKEVTQPCDTEEARKARAAWGANLLLRILSEDGRAIIAMHVDEAFAKLGKPFKARRDELAAIMRCSPSTVHTRIARGRRLWEQVTREAALSNENDSKPLGRDSAREDAALADATRALIAATLIQIDVRGEMDAIDKADQRAKTKMVSHSLLQLLDVLGLNNDTTRRTLANMEVDAQKQWCADQIRVAVAGTSEERASARHRCGANYHLLVRECVASHAKDAKNLKSKRLAEKAAK
ncbi:hypothetical protein [Bradyrhizobium lupini]